MPSLLVADSPLLLVASPRPQERPDEITRLRKAKRPQRTPEQIKQRHRIMLEGGVKESNLLQGIVDIRNARPETIEAQFKLHEAQCEFFEKKTSLAALTAALKAYHTQLRKEPLHKPAANLEEEAESSAAEDAAGQDSGVAGGGETVQRESTGPSTSGVTGEEVCAFLQPSSECGAMHSSLPASQHCIH